MAEPKPAQAVRKVMEDAQWEVHEVDESVRMDDNGVNTTEQMVELVRNAYQLKKAAVETRNFCLLAEFQFNRSYFRAKII